MTEIKLSDHLALERTKLANERTFLAYFRTFVVMLSSGIAILKVDLLSNLKLLGYILIVLSFILLAIGATRHFRVRRRIARFFK